MALKPGSAADLREKVYSVFLIALIIVVLTAGISYKLGFWERKYVIGYVNPNPEENEGAPGFLRNMPKYGFIEGKNVTYIKNESKDMKIIENVLRDMVAKRVDLILTMSTPATKMAKKLTQETNIPVVFIMYDAIGSGIVKSLVEHDNNITGVQLQGSTPKALEWLSVMLPGARHIFVPVSFDTGAAKQSLEKLKQSCEQLGFSLTVAEVKTVEELHASLSSMPKDTDAVFMLHSWLVGSHVAEVIGEANKRHIPVISAGHVDYQHGLVMSFAPADDATGMQAARLAHKILHGTPPAHMPVENAEVFLGINLRTARSAGLEIPATVLRRADYIIR
ncbi:MAG: ABC transporter substrate-binding protein [Nitrospirae bacterium]|nr:ABC transporter substrate-binding protein [Nitrospirota bacterium]